MITYNIDISIQLVDLVNQVLGLDYSAAYIFDENHQRIEELQKDQPDFGTFNVETGIRTSGKVDDERHYDVFHFESKNSGDYTKNEQYIQQKCSLAIIIQHEKRKFVNFLVYTGTENEETKSELLIDRTMYLLRIQLNNRKIHSNFGGGVIH